MLMKNGLKLLAVALLLATGAAGAEEKFPVKPIRMLVPFSAGSVTDFVVWLAAIANAVRPILSRACWARS